MTPQMLIIIFSSIYGLGVAASIGGSTIYDINDIKSRQDFLKHPHAKKYRRKPLVSLIITAHNAEDSLNPCLESILKSSYRKYEIIIVNNGSKDQTGRLVREFIKTHPKTTLKLVNKRKPATTAKAMAEGFKKHAKGEYVMYLDTDYHLAPHSLRNAVQHFAGHEDVSVIEPNYRALPEQTILNVLQQLALVLDSRFKKLYPHINSTYGTYGSGVMYRSDAFKRSLAKKPNKQPEKLIYGSNVVILSKPIVSYRKFFTARYELRRSSFKQLYEAFKNNPDAKSKVFAGLRLTYLGWKQFIVLAGPVMLAYLGYVGWHLRQPTLFGIALGVIAGSLAYIIWSDEQLWLNEKLRLTFFIPVTYSIFYIVALMDIVMTILKPINFKRISKLLHLFRQRIVQV